MPGHPFEVMIKWFQVSLWEHFIYNIMSSVSVQEILDKGTSFSDLLHMEKDELTNLLHGLNCSDLEIKTLLTAFNNLRACTGELTCGLLTQNGSRQISLHSLFSSNTHVNKCCTGVFILIEIQYQNLS